MPHDNYSKSPALLQSHMKRENIQVFKNSVEIGQCLAKQIETLANNAIKNSNNFFIGFSGGSLGKLICDHLPSINTDWTKWKIFFCDERYVPIDDPDSNFGLYKKLIRESNLVVAKNIFPIDYQLPIEECADKYWATIKNEYKGDSPEFDLLLLGIGPDGHCCSLFPGHKLLKDTRLSFVPITDSPKPPPKRITMTLPVVNNSRNIFVIVTGSKKAPIIKKIFEDSQKSEIENKLPIELTKPLEKDKIWFLDEDAMSLTKI